MHAKPGSKEGQDAMVLHLIPTPGFYLDIGANDPVLGNNTWRLREAEWTGKCFDRKAPDTMIDDYHVCDVTKADMKRIIGTVARVDYISFDVDRATEAALANFPFELYPFTIMTFEHDLYRPGGLNRKIACEERLEHGNYAVLAENVMANGDRFEDWWVNLDRFDKSITNLYMSDVPWQTALAKIKGL